MLDSRIAAADAVITTASVPGRPAPKIISRAAVERMRAGSVVVDVAAEQGGNCELTRAGETIEHQGVSIIGAVNLPAALAYNAELAELPQARAAEGGTRDRLERRGICTVVPDGGR